MHPQQTQFLQRVLFIFLGIIFASGPLVAQKEQLLPKSRKQLNLSNKVLSCYNPDNQSYYIFEDSTYYWVYPIQKGYWIQKPLQTQLEISWKQLKEDFQVQAVSSSKLYFVQNGCGIVYELKAGKLCRIDKSYEQKNQFGASVFTFQHKMHFFGGYGLFRTKNLITVFEPNAKEWFEVNNAHFDIKPPSRQAAQHQLIGNQLFIWGGIGRRGYKDDFLTDMWRFDFKKRSWLFFAELNPWYAELTKNMNTSVKVPTTWFTSREFLIHTDLKQNKIFAYESPNFLTYQLILPDQQQKHFLLLSKPTNLNQYAAKVVNTQQLTLGINPDEQYFYKKLSLLKTIPVDTYLWLSALLNVILFFLLFYIRRVHKTNWYKRRHAVLNASDFSDLEWRCLNLIHQHGSIELSALNDLFDEEQLSFETLKKRRESFVKALRTKVALLTALDFDDVLYETKHPLDKRMKIINWGNELEINHKQ
jgi:hypothetical protein